MQERIKLPLSNVRQAIQEVQTGSLDLTVAKVMRTRWNLVIRFAKLKLRAERLGMDDPLFGVKDGPSVDRSELKEFQNLVKQLSKAISAALDRAQWAA